MDSSPDLRGRRSCHRNGWRTRAVVAVAILAAGACARTRSRPPPPSPSLPEAELAALPEERVVFAERSEYNLVMVVDAGDMRYLRFGDIDGDDQSMISLTDPESVPMEYVRFGTIGLAYVEHAERLLMVGLGGGTLTTLLRRVMPELWIDVVDIDPVVVKVARRFFGVREDDRYTIHVGDGAAFVASAPAESYDLVFLDAYSGHGIPKHLRTSEFFAAVRTLVRPGGVVVANVAAYDIGVERALISRFRHTFPGFSCFETRDFANLIIVGKTGEKDVPERAALERRARELTTRLSLPFDLADVAERLGTGCDDLSSSPTPD